MSLQSDNVEHLFRELVRVSIGTEKCLSQIPTNKEWKSIYKIANKQSLLGICFAGIQKLCGEYEDGYSRIGLSEMLYLSWMGMAITIQQRNEVVNQRCIELQKRLSSDGFRSCVLKGQGIALLYSEDLRDLRQSGDIDVWVDADKEQAIEYVMQKYPTDDFGLRHIRFQCFADTEVELHWIPISSYNTFQMSVLRRYFDYERNRQFCNRVNDLCVPTSDFQVVHQLLHIYGHYVYEGVGLRQLMDLYFAQMEYDSCPKNDVVGLFKKLGLLKFVAATQWVLQEVFGMSESVMLCAPDEKEGRKLLDEIMIGGNFGHHDKRNYVAGESFVQRFFRRWGRRFRMFRFDPLGTLLMPFSRLKLEVWMRGVRRKYRV